MTPILGQIIRFGLVGTIGFVVDAGTLRLCIWLGVFDLYSGRVLSFLVAATTTYLLNKSFTFTATQGRTAQQLPLWLALMGISALINYGTYVLCLDLSEWVRQYPEIGVAAGSFSAMWLNFLSARFLVFRAHVSSR
jgi:putative flippase GtrA